MKIPGLGFILFSPLSDTFGNAVEILMFVGRVPLHPRIETCPSICESELS